MSSVAARVKSVVIEVLGISEEDVTDESSFKDHLCTDTSDFLDIIRELERQFNTDIPEGAVAQIDTVGDAIAYLSMSPRS